MKAVQLLINSVLPEDMRNYGNKYDVKDMNKILYAVAQKHPDKFAEVEKQLSDFGRKSSYLQGATITLKDLEPVVDKKELFSAMDAEIKALRKDKDFIKNRRVIFDKYNGMLSKMINERALANRNNIAMAVLSGARGKVPQLKAMIGSPWQFSDYKGEPIDVIAKNSFAEGIDPTVFLASTYGSRSSVISTKSATAKGGDLAKQFASTSVDVTVREENCHTHNGISLPVDDKSLIGRSLANDVAGHKAGTFITSDTIADLRKKGIKNVVARSAMTCKAHGGVCAHCVGKYYNGGKLPRIGDAVGLMASTASMEPVTQMALSSKHTAGMTSARKTYAGIPVITQFTQSPEKYKDKAVVSELDGKVEAIEEAEQGGTYITVNGRRHYVQAGHEPEVKVGDTVEAGDFLSEGLPDVEDVVRLKGLGAGRKLYADRLNQILSDSGAATDPRNTEVLARGALRHVRITSPDGFGNYLPDDLVDYDAIEHTYKMPEDTVASAPGAVVGKYLQRPFMHYTIGTRITPKVAKDLTDNGYDRVFAGPTAPSFEPEMVRLRSSSQQTRDWLASLGTSYLTQQLQESATRGADTNVEHNPDYRPRIAYGAGFGKNVRETGEF